MKSLLLVFLVLFQSLAGQVIESVVTLEPKPWGPLLWESKVPADCPIEQSEDLVCVVFTGQHADYTYADTWYPSWASDGNMYSPYTDGVSGIWRLSRSNLGKDAVVGHAKIVGDNPQDLQIHSLGTVSASAEPFVGRYPCGSLVYDGVWYSGTYGLESKPSGYNLGTLRPFAGFHTSTDYGETWTESPHNCASGLFEDPSDEVPIKIGAPHFVDFGKNMEHSPDGKAYLVGHGAMPDDPQPRPANLSWVTGDQVYLTRVEPSIGNMNDKSKYEYFCGYDEEGNAIWLSDFSKIKPIFEWNNHCGCVTMTYNPVLKKYIMSITDGWPTVKFMDTYFLESDTITGPWKMVTYMERFGEQGYFVNIPSKFISQDGYTSWLSYSGNFATFDDLGVNPPNGRYGFILQEMTFLTKEKFDVFSKEKNEVVTDKSIQKWDRNNPLTSRSNLSLQAKATASSVHPEYKVEAINDGVVGGFPNNPQFEWASDGETINAKIRLTWDQKIKASEIWIFDRPSHNEHVLSGSLSLSDGTIMSVGELPNSQYKGKKVSFPEKEIEWIEFTVIYVGRATNIGLAEIAVFE